MQSDPFSLDQADKTDDAMRGTLMAAFRGDADAVRFIEELAHVVHVWDDLIDKDKCPGDAAIHAAFTAAIVGFNLNAFFRAHAALLTPVLLSGILNWHAANDLERDGRLHCLQVAHVIRCSVGDVALLCAFAIGGMAHAQAWAAHLRMVMQQDSQADYLSDFAHNKGA